MAPSFRLRAPESAFCLTSGPPFGAAIVSVAVAPSLPSVAGMPLERVGAEREQRQEIPIRVREQFGQKHFGAATVPIEREVRRAAPNDGNQ